MIRAHDIVPAGAWEWSRERDHVALDWDHRHRRRILLTTAHGYELLIDLPKTTRLRHGDGLLLEGGGVVRVEAKPEALLRIHAHDRDQLVRIAWHLGNRHLPVQLLHDHIHIRADHVIAAMIVGLGGHVSAIQAPFDPEAGAYAPGVPHTHQHDDHHDHDHDHDHKH